MTFYILMYLFTVAVLIAVIWKDKREFRSNYDEIGKQFKTALNDANNELYLVRNEVYSYRSRYGRLETDKPINPDEACRASSARLSKELIRQVNDLLQTNYPLKKTVTVWIPQDKYPAVAVKALKTIYEEAGWEIEHAQEAETKNGKQHVLLFSKPDKDLVVDEPVKTDVV